MRYSLGTLLAPSLLNYSNLNLQGESYPRSSNSEGNQQLEISSLWCQNIFFDFAREDSYRPQYLGKPSRLSSVAVGSCGSWLIGITIL